MEIESVQCVNVPGPCIWLIFEIRLSNNIFGTNTHVQIQHKHNSHKLLTDPLKLYSLWDSLIL